MTAISDTPETDARAYHATIFVGASTYTEREVVNADDARTLERQRNEARSRIAESERRYAGVEAGTHCVVPKEPTPEMVKIGYERHIHPRYTRSSEVVKDVYRAMLAASEGGGS